MSIVESTAAENRLADGGKSTLDAVAWVVTQQRCQHNFTIETFWKVLLPKKVFYTKFEQTDVFYQSENITNL
jgi:hypothetical protein